MKWYTCIVQLIENLLKIFQLFLISLSCAGKRKSALERENNIKK